MTVEVTNVDKSYSCGCVDADISFTCPCCRERITDCITFSKELEGSWAVIEDYECPECSREITLEVDLT